MTAAVQSPTVNTTLNYFREVADGGLSEIRHGTVGSTRMKYNTQPVVVNDIRSNEGDFTLDKQGFQLVTSATKVKAFDEKTVKEQYYQELIDLIKETTDASFVLPMNHLVRQQLWESIHEVPADADDAAIVDTTAAPAMSVHIDQTPEGAELILQMLMQADAGRLGKTRWGIINAWRPLKLIRREPLAVCDVRSVPDSDLRVLGVIYPLPDGMVYNGSSDLKSDTWNVAANPEHKWYYASNMTPDEVLLLKMYDTKLDGRARKCPHSAFKRSYDEGPARESIETRCLVFWEDQERE